MLQSQFSWWIASFCESRYVKIPIIVTQKSRENPIDIRKQSHHPTRRQVGADTEQAIDGGATPLIVAAYKVRCFFFRAGLEDWWPNFEKLSL